MRLRRQVLSSTFGFNRFKLLVFFRTVLLSSFFVINVSVISLGFGLNEITYPALSTISRFNAFKLLVFFRIMIYGMVRIDELDVLLVFFSSPGTVLMMVLCSPACPIIIYVSKTSGAFKGIAV